MPPILAGVLAIYGLVVSVVITTSLREKSALHTNFLFLAAGISVGLSCLASGFCIGIVGDAGVRASGLQPRMYVGMMMMLIFAEVLGEFTFYVFYRCRMGRYPVNWEVWVGEQRRSQSLVVIDGLPGMLLTFDALCRNLRLHCWIDAHHQFCQGCDDLFLSETLSLEE